MTEPSSGARSVLAPDDSAVGTAALWLDIHTDSSLGGAPEALPPHSQVHTHTHTHTDTHTCAQTKHAHIHTLLYKNYIQTQTYNTHIYYTTPVYVTFTT